MPAILAAANIIGGTTPSLPGGVARMISLTPATRAGIAVMRRAEGSGAVPPGA